VDAPQTLTPVQPAQRRRGRPYRPPVDPSSYASAAGGEIERIAWLLGTTRLYASGGAYFSRRDFVPALVGAGVPADESRVSRWEAAGVAAPDSVIDGYERVLGLGRGELLVVANCLRPVTLPAPQPATLDELHTVLDPLFELVLDGSPTGADWLRLSDTLLAQPAIYLPPDLWERLASRLLNELGRSLHLGYASRLLALRRLLAVGVARRHVVPAIGRVAIDHCAPRTADAIALLQYVPGAYGTGVAMRLLDSDQEVHRRGAARAVAAMLASHTFDMDAMPALEATAIRLLGEDENATHIADLVRRMPGDSLERVRAAVHGHPAMALVLRTSEVVSADTARQVALRIAEEAVRFVTEILGSEPDPMLERLTREALFHSHAERRHRAAMLLAFSPFRVGVATGITTALTSGADAYMSGRLTRLLRFCVSAEELPVLLELSSSTDPTVRAHALRAIGNVPAELDELEAAALAVQAEPWSNSRHAEATMYALGMHGWADVTPGANGANGAVGELCAWWSEAGSRLTA
jgi:hypothetical protein